MASRHADPSRSRHDSGRYSPRRDDRRYAPYSRDDRRDHGRRDGRDSRADRYDDRRDSRRDRDSYRRRSRSPPRRDRSRDRRYHNERPRRDRSRSRDRSRDRRYRGEGRRPSDTPSLSSARTASDRPKDVPREDKPKKGQETKELDKEAKLAKLEKWKKQQQEKLAQKQAGTPGTVASPTATTPSTPTVAATPPASEAKQEPAKAKAPPKSAAEKTKQSQPQKSTFKLDESAAARPLPFKSANKPGTASITKPVAPAPSKVSGNIGSFGLKTKHASEEATTKNALLDDEDNTGKRALQTLPEFAPVDGPSPAADDDAAMSDIGSDDEETNAQLQAQLEKRREEIANEDSRMEDAPVTTEAAGDQMDVDDTAGAEDDVDPLDAFMADLSEKHTEGNRVAPQGQAMFGDDHEPDLTAVEDEDLLALAASKKKKKEIPVIDHSKVQYEPFRKNFYNEPAEISELTPEEVADLRHELDGIKVNAAKTINVPRPVTRWGQMGLLQQTMDVFTKVRYEKPTSIQAQAIPIAESGLDLIGVAKTGSGKTLAFGIPMIRHILDQPPLRSADGPIGLILAPTRELSLQIVNELKPFLKASNLKIDCAYGGAPISEQISMIKRGGIHVLCATPGRLIDLLQSNSGRVLSFKRITYVVLDEADRMFDMGFEPQVMKILGNTRPDRQTILFSATFPKNMAALARKALSKPVEVVIGGRSVVAPEINQIITVVQPSYEKKLSALLLQLGQLFAENENAQCLIFVEKQETAEDLLSKLIKSKYSAVNSIHGAKDQTDRNEALNDFRQGVLPILIATSVAARGLDVPGLAMVFNLDCPTHLEDYVHRVGRTGRAGKSGTAVTLIENPGQERFAVHIAKALKQSGQPVPEDVQAMARAFDEKVKAGTEKWYDPGFGGKGLDKLDAARALEKRREKRAHNIEGDDQSEDEEEALPVVKKADATPGPSGSNGAGAGSADTDDQPAYMKLLSSKIVVSKTERPEAGPAKPMTAMEKVKAAANKVDGRLSKKGMIHAGQPIDNKGPDAGAYHSTIEINDFPQKARWAVTNRTNVAKILESTGVSITSKGIYYAPGKEPAEGELPKLYILVEGDTENVVTQAMMELTRLLRDATMNAEEPTTRGATGRYNVV